MLIGVDETVVTYAYVTFVDGSTAYLTAETFCGVDTRLMKSVKLVSMSLKQVDSERTGERS